MTTKKILVFVDSREPYNVRTPIINLLKRRGAEIKVLPLVAGDYESEYAIVERKGIQDYESSFIGGNKTSFGRIERQLLELSMASEKKNKPAWIVIHGNPKSLYSWTLEQLYGSVASMSVRYFMNVVLIPAEWKYEYILSGILLKSAEEKCGLPWSIKYIRSESKKVGAVATIFRVSPKTAKNLLKRFKTIKGVFNATEKELQLVSGIGKIRAKRLYEFVNQG